MNDKASRNLQIGDSAEFTKTITEGDITLFAGVTGDFNPVHINKVWADNSRFQGRIAHGMLSAGMISGVIGMQLPGPGTIYMSQEIKFLAPVYLGDTITARVEVIEFNQEKNRARLRTTCHNQTGKLVVDGIAQVMTPA
ncbi:MAG TPA: MaoC family dehydratase [Dehalococcoidales bacterium]|nr:MaoC family dehydratase [Dehalococcoidales bacterium]